MDKLGFILLVVLAAILAYLAMIATTSDHWKDWRK